MLEIDQIGTERVKRCSSRDKSRHTDPRGARDAHTCTAFAQALSATACPPSAHERALSTLVYVSARTPTVTWDANDRR